MTGRLSQLVPANQAVAAPQRLADTLTCCLMLLAAPTSPGQLHMCLQLQHLQFAGKSTTVC